MLMAKGLVKEMISHSKKTGDKILIVPGGSIFADTIRKINVQEEAAHWMAVLAMEQYGYYLSDGTGARLKCNLEVDEPGTYILLPYNLLKQNDELPHSWDVTSDTIAAWVSLNLGARFLKATDVDGIFINGVFKNEIEARELNGKETCVDIELPHYLLKNKMTCEIINGTCPGRLISAIKGNVSGTIIKG